MTEAVKTQGDPTTPAACEKCGSTEHPTGNHHSGVADAQVDDMSTNGNHNSGSPA